MSARGVRLFRFAAAAVLAAALLVAGCSGPGGGGSDGGGSDAGHGDHGSPGAGTGQPGAARGAGVGKDASGAAAEEDYDYGAGGGGTGAGGTGGDGGAAMPASREVTVTLGNFRFEPAVLRLRAGETVTLKLVNDSGAPHTFTIEELGVDVSVSAGETASVTLTPEAGTYRLVCTYHEGRGMEGTVEATE